MGTVTRRRQLTLEDMNRQLELLFNLRAASTLASVLDVLLESPGFKCLRQQVRFVPFVRASWQVIGCQSSDLIYGVVHSTALWLCEIPALRQALIM